MKKLLLILVLIASFVIGYSQTDGTLYMTAYSDAFCQKSATTPSWNAWQQTNATFYLYKAGDLTTKIVIVTPGGSTLTFYGYANERTTFDNGDFRYSVYCYEAGENSTKTFDKTEYFRMTDHKAENYSVYVLIGRDGNDYAWQIKSFNIIK